MDRSGPDLFDRPKRLSSPFPGSSLGRLEEGSRARRSRAEDGNKSGGLRCVGGGGTPGPPWVRHHAAGWRGALHPTLSRCRLCVYASCVPAQRAGRAGGSGAKSAVVPALSLAFLKCAVSRTQSVLGQGRRPGERAPRQRNASRTPSRLSEMSVRGWGKGRSGRGKKSGGLRCVGGATPKTARGTTRKTDERGAFSPAFDLCRTKRLLARRVPTVPQGF